MPRKKAQKGKSHIKTVRKARPGNLIFAAVLAVIFITSGMVLVGLTGSALAQQGDESRRFLDVRQRQLELQAARRQHDRTVKLAAEGLVPQTDVDRDRSTVVTAQLNYQRAVLALLDLQPRISVRSAVKTQTRDGRRFVRVTLTNLTPTFDDSQFRLLNNFDGADPIPEELRTRVVNDVFVSLRDSGVGSGDPGVAHGSSTTISLPYESHIPQMAYGAEKTLDFQLLRDVDSLVISIAYRGQAQEVPVQLERGAGETQAQILSSQFSQEADLGGQATFNITVERPSVDVRNFRLRVVNLPEQISYSFIDLQSQARLSEINFPAGITRQSLGLRLFLPESASEEVQVDRPIEFWALALDGTDRAPAADQQVIGANSGKVKLVVLPRGVAKVQVSAASLFSEIEAGQVVETKMTFRNAGTRALNNLRLSAECPLNWRVLIEPGAISSLDINREDVVAVRIVPPSEVLVGDYEVRIKTESFADNRKVESEDKVYRVSVKAKPNFLGTGVLIGGLLLLIVGVVVVGGRMTRR